LPLGSVALLSAAPSTVLTGSQLEVLGRLIPVHTKEAVIRTFEWAKSMYDCKASSTKFTRYSFCRIPGFTDFPVMLSIELMAER
jgi:hypothetical protein